jgi:hypothetical protein
MTPTPEEVLTEVEAVHAQVAELGSTPEGIDLMLIVREEYPEHDE